MSRGRLRVEGTHLVSVEGRRYPIVDGIPVMLVSGIDQTLWVAGASLAAAEHPDPEDPYFLGTLGVTDEQRENIRRSIAASGVSSGVDPVVSWIVAHTSGLAYTKLVGNLPDYPIPEIRLPAGSGERLLDVGSNWGRWCISAARKGYRCVGLDPQLGAVLAMKRLAKHFGVEILGVVGDARHLPFRDGVFDVGFSYGVLQHFSRRDAAEAVSEVGRVLKSGGYSLVQMPTVFGLRCLYNQVRRGFRDPGFFGVRYYTIPALRRLFEAAIGKTEFSVHCFFGIGWEPADRRFMGHLLRAILIGSELLRHISQAFPALRYVADSVYVRSRKHGKPRSNQ